MSEMVDKNEKDKDDYCNNNNIQGMNTCFFENHHYIGLRQVYWCVCLSSLNYFIYCTRYLCLFSSAYIDPTILKYLCILLLKLRTYTFVYVSLNTTMSALLDTALLYGIPSCLEQAFLMQNLFALIFLSYFNYFYNEFFHDYFDKSYFINWSTQCKKSR